MDLETRRALARIEAMLRRQYTILESIMSGEDDLKAAIAANGAAITTAANALNDLANKIIAATNGDSDADIEALANQLKVETTQLNLAVSNATQPAPAPAQNTGGAATPTPTQNAGAPAATAPAA